MIVTVPTKDVGEVRDKFVPQCESVRTLEDSQAEYIKRNMEIEDANGRY